MNDSGAVAELLVMIVIGALLYFIPTVVGWNKKNHSAIFALNLLLGWTLVGWVVALVWALIREDQRVVVHNTAPAPSILCRSCGKYSPFGSRFCTSCGGGLLE